MFIAHAPSGYLLATQFVDRARTLPVRARVAMAAGVIGALAPDFDMLWFYLVDARQTHHHKYISHWPVLWLSLLLLALLWRHTRPLSAGAAVLGIFSAGGLLHMVLDSVVGDIWWFAPFIDRPFALFTVPALHTPWWLNFLLHWSFALELAICVGAVITFRRRQRSGVPAKV
ncbi:metal-dependent hydrolase [Methyloversatilis sp. MC4-4]|uniref:metal-dependent hydrolase n=1 Tax=Methyloversatilis sp. MC4-4 TaxID=3132824 RepID=UPI003CE95050